MAFLLSFLVLGLLIGGLILGILFWVTSGSGSKEMACGSCGYAVRGLTQLHCPECGVDLREAGIRKSGNSRRRGLGIALTLGCGTFILALCGLSGFWFMSVKQPVHVPKPSITTSAPKQTLQQMMGAAGNVATNTPNPDGTTTLITPDGSTTVVQPDGTTTSFDPQGNEIVTPNTKADTGETIDAP